MKKCSITILVFFISNCIFGQKQNFFKQESILDSDGLVIAHFEKINCKAAGDYCQYVIRNSRNEVDILIYIRYLTFDSLRTKDNIGGSSYYLEFVFPNKFLKAQVDCTKEQVISSKFVKKIVSRLCKTFSGCGNCAANYGLEEEAVNKFINLYPVKDLID